MANGKNTLKELEAAANKAFSLEWEANEFRQSHGDDPEIRLARLRFTIAYLNLEGVLDGLWDGTRTLKDAETALRAVHKTLNAGTRDLTKVKHEKADYEQQISSQMTTLRKELDKRRKKTEREALRTSKAVAAPSKEVAGLSGTRKISDKQRSIVLERAVAAAQQELNVRIQRARWLEQRAVQGTASLKQAEAALIAESQALRKFTEARGRIEISWRVASSLRQAKDDLAQLELRKQAAERAKQERQKKLRLRESLVLEDVTRLKSLGIKRLEEWRVVHARGEYQTTYWGVVKIQITRAGRISTVRSILHELTEDYVFGGDARILPIESKEAGEDDLDKLQQSLTTGMLVGELQSVLAQVLFDSSRRSEEQPYTWDQLAAELEEVLQAFEKPVLSEELLERL